MITGAYNRFVLLLMMCRSAYQWYISIYVHTHIYTFCNECVYI